MQNKKTSKYSKMIELQDESVTTTPSFGFDQISEPLPIKPLPEPEWDAIDSAKNQQTKC